MSAVVEVREPGARYLASVQPALVRQFDLVATAPGGVARLRELILTLAVRGALFPQRPSDEPATVLLERIRAERTRLNAREKVNRGMQPPRTSEDFQPFDLPVGWEWSSLSNIGRWAIGSGFPHEAQGRVGLPILFAKISDMNLPGNEFEISRTNHTIDAETVDRLRVNVHPAGTVVFPKIGGAIATNKRRILIRPTAIDNNCLGITPYETVSTSYLFLLLTSIDFTAYQAGTSVPALSQGTLGRIVVGLPPLAEQARIVARVDELMRLCDALEAQGRLEAEQHARLLGTLLGTLTDSSTPEELAANWQRVADHFDLLLDRPEAVDALEQTILQLAVRGLLVPQDSSAPALNSAETDGGEPLFPNWTRSRFGDVVSMLNGYAFKSEWFLASGTRLVRNVNVGHGQLDWQTVACVSPKVADEYAQFSLSEGDVVLTLDRPIISTGLKLAVVRSHDLPCLLLQRVARLSPNANVLSRDFMLLWLRSDAFVKAIDPGRSNGVPHISTKQVAALTIDLPPLAEQARIVARVSELRHLCANLRQRLTASQSTQSHLAEALVAEVA